jgi:hypothetical protein
MQQHKQGINKSRNSNHDLFHPKSDNSITGSSPVDIPTTNTVDSSNSQVWSPSNTLHFHASSQTPQLASLHGSVFTGLHATALTTATVISVAVVVLIEVVFVGWLAVEFEVIVVVVVEVVVVHFELSRTTSATMMLT